MPSTPSLNELIDQEYRCLSALREILAREQQALTQTDVADLEKITAEKNIALGQQLEASQRREQAVEGAGYAGEGATDLEKTLLSTDPSGALAERFRALVGLARDCHAANRSNGRLITKQRGQAQQALDILRQSDTPVPVYSGAGNTLEERSNRLLGKA